MVESESKWYDSFKKSIKDNSQLVFSKKVTISVISEKTIGEEQIKEMEPISEILDIYDENEFISNLSSNLNNKPIIVYIDNRSSFYSSLISSSQAFISCYFPLTREKYRMHSQFVVLNNSNNDSQEFDPKNILVKNNLELINSHLSNINNSNKIKTESYKEKLTVYLKKFENLIMKNLGNKENFEKIINNFWNELSEEEKLQYQNVEPESFKVQSYQINDVDKFDSQEKLFPIKNFAVVLFFPYVVEITIYPKPQVVANSRKPNFESLYKPRKVQFKYIFWFEIYEDDSNSSNEELKFKVKWKLNELNP